ncbi:ferredoxin-NADP reductase [Arthrobacter sp. UYNi723]
MWSVRQPDDAYYARLIQDHCSAHPGRFNAYIRVGRFTRAHIANRLTQEQLDGAMYVVVGPNTAVLAMQQTLRGLGVSRARIHQERLTM